MAARAMVAASIRTTSTMSLMLGNLAIPGRLFHSTVLPPKSVYSKGLPLELVGMKRQAIGSPRMHI